MLQELVKTLVNNTATRDNPQIVILRGLPGAGKTAVADYLRSELLAHGRVAYVTSLLNAAARRNRSVPGRKLQADELLELDTWMFADADSVMRESRGYATPNVLIVDSSLIFNEDVSPYIMLARLDGMVPHIVACIADPYEAYKRSRKFYSEAQLVQLVPKFMGEIMHQPPFWPKALHVYPSKELSLWA
jgi:hypothetical protein